MAMKGLSRPTARARSGNITNRKATPIVPAKVGANTAGLVSSDRFSATSSPASPLITFWSVNCWAVSTWSND